MAGVCTRYGDRANVGLMEFCCDEISEVQDAPTTTSKGKGVFSAYQQCAPMGSTLIVGLTDFNKESYSSCVLCLPIFFYLTLSLTQNNINKE